VGALGLAVREDTTINNTAEMIVIGTTGINPKTAVPPGVRDKTSMPATDQATTGGPGAGAGTTY
jgi:hypothetical protein